MILSGFLIWAAAAMAQVQLISRPIPPADVVERGRAAFVSACGFCHGTEARGGDGGPDLVRSVVVLDDENGDLIGPVVRNGRPQEGMPSFPMSDAQIRDIAAFLRERTQAAINRREYKILDVVTGDAKAGEAYFNARCASCHSSAGDLKGIAAKFDPVALQARFLYPRSPRARAKPTPVTVTPASGPPISGTLELMDDFVIGIRDADGYYHSWSRDTVKADIRDPLAGHAELLRNYADADVHNVLAYLVTLR